MNRDKKNVNLTGVAVLPIMLGARALLACGGQYIRTSRVVNIHERTPQFLRFDTMDSNYFVTLTHSPPAAACQMMAA